MAQKITIMNNDNRVFMGLYESNLHNSDTDYELIQDLLDYEGDANKYEVEYDFDEFKTAAGEACVDSLNNELYSHDVIIDMTYAGMNSPKYYNYDTDRVLIDVDYNFIQLVKYCRYTNKGKFNQYLKDNFTSYDGYISFVENNVDDFFNKEWFNSHKDMAIDVMIEFYLINEINLEAHEQNMYEDCQQWLYCNAELKQVEPV